MCVYVCVFECVCVCGGGGGWEEEEVKRVRERECVYMCVREIETESMCASVCAYV